MGRRVSERERQRWCPWLQPTVCFTPTDNLHWYLIYKIMAEVVRQLQLKRFYGLVHFTHHRLLLLCSLEPYWNERKIWTKLWIFTKSACLYISSLWQNVSSIPLCSHYVSNKKQLSNAIQKKFVCIKDVCICQSQPSTSTVLSLPFLMPLQHNLRLTAATVTTTTTTTEWTVRLERNFYCSPHCLKFKLSPQFPACRVWFEGTASDV